MSAPRRVVVLGTGGTIVAVDGPAGAVPGVGVGELLGGAGVGDTTDVETVDVLAIDSSAMTPALQRRVRDAVSAALHDPDVAGVVVTHGTDTLEETAILLDLTHADPRPVVLTGAQRPASDPRPDGPANLAAAIALARDPAARARGVLVAVGGATLPARGLSKAHTTDPVAFAAVVDDPARPVMPAATDVATPRVDVVAVHPGMDVDLIDVVVGRGARGLVVSGYGSGNVHPDLAARLASVVSQGVAVIVTTRVPAGPVTPTYGGGGGAVDLVAAGILVSPWLRTPQARIVLQEGIARGMTAEQISPFLDLRRG
ncbi:asparaginase [Williamsia deligens]|uniref:Asparaginase n=1 Tax=Williamsia deligens TaxID=321325 RepID=A0ABW3G9H3_9NOCA|nr:asparaginase [Williamsia deligens]MCP2195884.1 L-asparaginase [Williamsia deligens]